MCAFFSNFAIAGGPPPALVKVESAKLLDIAPVVMVTGTVIGRDDANVAAEVEGRLEYVLEVGDVVEQGGVLAKIDATRYELAVNQIIAEIKPIETMLDFYRKEGKRLEMLAENNNAAKNQLDETMANRDQSIAQIQQVKARLAMAKDDLNRTKIYAPFPGVISERLKITGERVEQGDEIVRLVNTSSLEIQAYVQRNTYLNLNQDDEVIVNDDQGSFSATVKTIIPVGDSTSRLYEIRLETTERELIAGTAVKVAVPTAKKQKVLSVHRDALVIRQAGTVIYKIDENNIASLIPVQTGIANTAYIQVKGPLNEGDRIVIRGNERLRPGQNVQVIDG